MKEYVAGLYFKNKDTVDNEVALVKKARPEWQKNRLNAIGGKVESGESADKAMIREFREETGVQVEDWELFSILVAPTWRVSFYRAFGDPKNCQTTTDEPIITMQIEDFLALSTDKHISNLKWIVPLALNIGRGIKVPSVIEYES